MSKDILNKVIFDEKLFDYKNSKGPFIAVPKVFFKNYLNLKTQKIKIDTKKNKVKKLTTKDILKSVAVAKKEFKLGKLIRL